MQFPKELQRETECTLSDGEPRLNEVQFPKELQQECFGLDVPSCALPQ